jgi:hypothetical protein
MCFSLLSQTYMTDMRGKEEAPQAPEEIYNFSTFFPFFGCYYYLRRSGYRIQIL